MSRFVVVEGIDGAGKTTLSKSLFDRLQLVGFEVVRTREPGGTPKAEEIRNRLFSEAGKTLSVSEQMALVHEGRIDHIKSVIVPALEAGKVVLSDRFEMSSIVYQVWHDKELLAPIYKQYEKEIETLLGKHTPEYIHLTLPAETVQQRQLQSNDINVFDAVELEPIEDRIAAYSYAVGMVRGRVYEIDASQTPQTVLENTLNTLQL